MCAVLSIRIPFRRLNYIVGPNQMILLKNSSQFVSVLNLTQAQLRMEEQIAIATSVRPENPQPF